MATGRSAGPSLAQLRPGMAMPIVYGLSFRAAGDRRDGRGLTFGTPFWRRWMRPAKGPTAGRFTCRAAGACTGNNSIE